MNKLTNLLLLVTVYLCGVFMAYTPVTQPPPGSAPFLPLATSGSLGVRSVTVNPLDFGWLQSAKESTVMVQTPTGHGSGVVIGRKGVHVFVLTALHVVKELSLGDDVIVLRWASGDTDFDTTAWVKAKSDSDDLALVEGDDYHELLKPVPMGVDSPDPGLIVIACGYPLDIYPPSVTIGFSRGIEFSDETPYLLHSANLWFGNSGGPLFNDKGALVGINVMIGGYNGHAASDRCLSVPVERILIFTRGLI